MKKLLIALSMLVIGCSEPDYTVVNTNVVKGIISAKDKGHIGRISELPTIYVQNDKSTIKINIPFANENDFKVGDTIMTIIQQVEKAK